MNKWIPEHSCDKKTPICDVLKQKKNDVKNTPPETIRNEKTQQLKRNKTQKMPTAVLRGDSQSGSAANAPIRSALSLPFYLS